MMRAAPAVKVEEESASKDEPMKDASAEEDEKATKEPETTQIKTETSEPAASKEESKSKDADTVKEVTADEVAKEIGAAMVSLASTEEKKPKETTEDEDAQIKLENEESSDSESSTVEENDDSSKEKTTSAWDNGYTNELKSMYSDVDADTRAVAEEMIRAATAGTKKPEDDASKSSKDTENSPAAIAPKPADTSSKETESKEEPKKTVIGKGQEPSALELALKQQGITQSDQLRSTQFPFRLHNMLDDAERSGHAHIVSWCPGGDSFKIHKPAKLIQVLQKYFRQSKFKSFLRQLQGYNFKRITRGKDQGVVSHPLFLRGRRSVSTLMRRKRVGPKPESEERANKMAAAVRKTTGTINTRNGPKLTPAQQAAAQAAVAQQRAMQAHPVPSAIHSAAAGFMKSPAPLGPVINPHPQDVLCVDYPNGHQVRQFQGNRKLASIVQKITGHYTSANESVRTMIVNEISSRIQNSGSRFLKLSKDGLSWVECNREEMFRKVISCFEQEILSKEKGQIDLTREADSPVSGVAIDKVIAGLQGGAAVTDSARRIPPRNQDVVLRGGPGSEREGNTYLKTMIQANVGQQLDSFEMKRIKCRAILERMKRRGSRFFLKLKDTDTDDEMYILSDAEAQDVIYTAFCAEEKKVQSILADPPSSTASNLMRAKALAGLDTGHPSLPGLGAGAGLGAGTGLAGPSPYAASRAAALQSDAALLSQIKANNEMNLLASQNSLKRPLPGVHGHLGAHESIIEKRLRAETDEHIKLLIERERQRRTDPYAAAAGLTGRLPFHGRSLETGLPLSAAAFGAGAPAPLSANSRIDMLLKERQADELLLKQAQAARAPFAGVPTPGLAPDHPKSNNHFVEFLKKKYVKSAQERAW